MLDFVARDFPQYGKWSMDTFCAGLRQLTLNTLKTKYQLKK